MKSYFGMAGTANDFPIVTTSDDTAPGAHDGTPLLDAWLRDLFGAFQAVLNGASITPSGNAETCGAAGGNLTGSQLAEAIQLIAGYPGEIFLFPAPTATLDLPAGMRAKKLEGQTIVMADYPRLDAAVYCGNAANGSAPAFWHASDTPGTVPNPAGPYLVLPDLRGRFVRGLDLAAVIDPDGNDRLAGSIQNESIAAHKHDKIWDGASEMKDNVTDANPGAIVGTLTLTAGGNSVNTGDTGAGIGVGTANETRPTNMSFTWCIRY